MYLVGESVPLHAVFGCFCPSGKSGWAYGIVAAFWHDVSHASTEAYGIGGDDAFVVAVAGESHHAVVVFALVEFECAEIHPCASSDLLIHLKLGDTSLVVNGVGGFVG